MERTLKEIIESSPASREFKPVRVGTKTFRFENKDVRMKLKGDAGELLEVTEYGALNSTNRNAGCTNHIKQIIYEKWKSAEKKGYTNLTSKRIYLLPIEPDTTYKSLDWGILVHQGLIINGTNNIENLLRLGVFGNPSIDSPTYIMKMGSGILTGTRGPKDYGNEVTLFLDKRKLLEKRSIFIDPETIGKNGETLTGDIEGHSFFVLGGIPKEAIKKYRRDREGSASLF